MASVLKILAAAALAASAALPALADEPRRSPPPDIRFEALSPQPLERGRCGLFLWARSSTPPILLMTVSDDPSAARVRANGSQRNLPRTRFAGTPVHGQFERQTFSDGRLTLELEVQFDEERPIRDGAIVKQGVVRVFNPGGWETVMPVGGMVACQT
jgi:hypothetical protein